MPTVFPPGEITYLDRFDRSDGNVWDGDGATLWSETARDGSASLLRVSGNRLVATGEGGGLTLEDETDGIRIFTVGATGSGYCMFFFRFDAGTGDGYALSMAGGTWTLYEVTGGTLFTDVDTHSSTGTLTAGLRVGIRFEDDEVSVVLGTSQYFNTTPVWSSTGLTNTGSGTCGFQFGSSQWGIDDYASGDLVAPSSAVTIYVNPDHGAASDAYTRTQASDPDTPLSTAQQAGWLARAGVDWADTILVSVCESADLGDATDPQIQPRLDYRSTDRSTDAVGWPWGDNSGNLPITFKGDVTIADLDDVKTLTLPKIKLVGYRGLKNWVFEGLQFGYDVDSGDDYSTFTGLERGEDITWRKCLFTGGMGIAQHWGGAFHIDTCAIHSPFPPSGAPSILHTATGLRMEQAAGEGTGVNIGQLLVEDSEFSNIRGDDALTVGGFYMEPGFEVIDEASDIQILRTLFHNIAEDPDHLEFHTDAIQLLQVRRCIVDQCAFIGNSNALISSDFRSGLIRFTRNLTVALDTPVAIQGCDEVEILQNTFNHADCTIKDSTLLFYTREVIPQKTLATIQNNLIGGFFMRDTPINSYFRSGSVIDHNLVTSNPGLSTDFGTNLPGIPEFGTTARLDVLPVDTVTVGTVERNWELANSPNPSPGIGQGTTTDVTDDYFDRAFADPPDVGCFQSDPGTLVTPVSRPPYILTRNPLANATGVATSVSVTASLYPVPGQEIEGTTVTTSTAYVTDPANFTIPAVVTLSSPVSGAQTVTVDLKTSVSPTVLEGSLFPLVTYTAHLVGIEDTEGSALASTTWTFRTIGTGSAAVEAEGVDAVLEFVAPGEAGAVIRRIAEAITAAASEVPDANPTGPPIEVTFAQDPDSGERTVTVSGGGMPTHTVLV